MRILSKSLLLLGSLIPIIVASPAPQNVELKGKYLVTIKKGTNVASHTAWVNQVHKRNIAKRDDGSFGITKTFQSFPVYAGHFDDATVEEIRSSPDVVFVEQDQIWRIYTEPQSPREIAAEGEPVSHLFRGDERLTARQFPPCRANAGSALGALSHKTCGSNEYCSYQPGTANYAYVLDTGVYLAHTAFGGRASFGYSAISGSTTDGNGHGTHVAGVICSTYGVTGCNIVAVKVFDDNGSGSISGVLGGYDWAVNDIKSKGRLGRHVINLSLGGSRSNAFNTAIANAYNQGIMSVAAAGSSNQDVSNTSPGSAPEAFTVATHAADCTRASYSNYGSGIDIFAGGQNVLSTWIGSPTATNTLSGTSMSAAIVSGLAMYLQALHGLTSTSATIAKIFELAINGQIGNPGSGTPNRRAYNGSGL